MAETEIGHRDVSTNNYLHRFNLRHIVRLLYRYLKYHIMHVMHNSKTLNDCRQAAGAQNSITGCKQIYVCAALVNSQVMSRGGHVCLGIFWLHYDDNSAASAPAANGHAGPFETTEVHNHSCHGYVYICMMSNVSRDQYWGFVGSVTGQRLDDEFCDSSSLLHGLILCNPS